MSTLEDIFNQWENNPEFRTEFKKNPEAALKKFHLELDPLDLKKIESMIEKKQKGSHDEKLDERISK